MQPVPTANAQPQAETSEVSTTPENKAAPPPAVDPVEPVVGSLEPYDVSALGCYGPDHDDGYYGQCCVDAACYTPDGDEPCAEPKEARANLAELLPEETGECSCPAGPDQDVVIGPYAAARDNDERCCYLAGSISCEGRAFLVMGEPRVAGVLRRSDWLA